MEELLEISQNLVINVNSDFKRYLFERISWNKRLIGIKGARGTGKTTLLLQRLKDLQLPPSQAAYFSLDELYFTTHSLVETASSFYKKGGKLLILDEVHKYPTWSIEIKNLYDRYKNLQIVFTGSSIMEISRQEADLSRRALMYELRGMSYREYLRYQHKISLPALTLNQILSPNSNIRKILPTEFKPLANFEEYIRFGYYPFYREDGEHYYARLRQLVRKIVEYDMAELKGFDIRHAKKLLQLLYVIAQAVPFKPNLTKLSAKTQIHRNSINNYLHFLDEARLIDLLLPEGVSISTLQKPEKIYLNNTNLLYALSETLPSEGTVREVFFNNQLKVEHQVNQASKTDFKIDDKFYFEVGGRNKGGQQIRNLQNTWIVKDGLEYSVGRSIPLWLFGFLY